MDNLREIVRRSLAWTAAQQWGVQAIRMVVLLVLARMISPAAFGTFAFASTIVGVAQLVCSQGMTAALFQRHRLEDRHRVAAFASMLAGGLLFTAVLIAAAPWLAHLLNSPTLVPLLRLLAWSLPLNALSGVTVALWRRDLNFQRVAVVTTSSQMLASIAAIALAARGFGIWSLAMRMMGEAFLMALLTCRTAPWKLLFRASCRSIWSGYRDMSRIAFPIAGVNLMALGRSRIDELLIGSILGAEALGYYALARRQIDGIASMVPAVIVIALGPILSRIQHDAPRVRIVMLRGIGILGALTLPPFIGIGATAGTWVPLFLGVRWQPSVPVLQGLAAVAATRAVVGFSLASLFAIGHSGRRFLIEAVTTSVSLLITIAALPWGIRGIAYACAAGMILLTPFELLWLSRWLGVSLRDQFRALRAPLLGAATLLALIVLLQMLPALSLHPILRLSIFAISGGLILLFSYRSVPPLPDFVP
jgi:O-antigen/teichoic acid export membrane protein